MAPKIGSSPSPVVSQPAWAEPPPDTSEPVPPAAGAEVRDYFGDKKNPAVPKDGYLEIKVGGSGDNTYPSSIKLANGTTAQVKPVNINGEKFYEIKAGKETLYAQPLKGSGGQFSFYTREPAGRGRDGDLRFGDHLYSPVRASNLPQVFTEAFAVATGGLKPKLDPATIQANYQTKLDAAMGPTRKQADRLAAESKGLMQESMKGQQELDEALEPLMPAIEHGEIKPSTDAEGQVHFELQQTPGMSNKEFAKLQNRFGGAIQLAQMKAKEVQDKLSSSIANRNGNAEALYNSLNRPEMQKFFASLPPDKRLQEFNRYAGALAGTPAGQKLADDLFNPNSLWKPIDANGVLRPRPGSIASTVLQGAYDSPASKAAMQGLVLSLAPHIKTDYGGTNPGDTKVRMFELTLGRKLDPAETEAAQKLAYVKGPAELAGLIEGEEGPGGESHKGVYAELLAQLGEAGELEGTSKVVKVQNEILEKMGVKNPLEHLAPKIKLGASFLATYSAYESLRDVMHEGANLQNVTELAENTTRTVSTWSEVGSLVSDADWLEKTGKVAGVTASALGAVADTIKAVKAESPEAREHHIGQAVLSAGVVVASVADAPMVVVGLLAWKLFGSKGPSESYDHAYGDLKKVENAVVP